jgi:type III restriction enzyme
MHDYVPDFIIRLTGQGAGHLIIETKGYDELVEVKRAAAERWVAAVNADGRYGRWQYRLATRVADVPQILEEMALDAQLAVTRDLSEAKK